MQRPPLLLYYKNEKKKKREKNKNAPARRSSLVKMNRMESNEIFDWTASEENLGKWRGLFVTPLKKVLQQVHPQFTAKEDALDYVENLLFRLLALLTAKPVPLSTSDVEVLGSRFFKCQNLSNLYCLQKRVSDRFPNPLGDLAKGFAKEELNKSRRKSTIEFSRDKIHSLLKEVLHGHKVDDQVNVYLVAVLHYIASDILKVGPTLDFDMVTNFDVFAF